MHIFIKNIRVQKEKVLAFTMIAAFIFLPQGLVHAASPELPQATYVGISEVPTILRNLNFSDLKNSKAIVKEAIYETGALNNFVTDNAKHSLTHRLW